MVVFGLTDVPVHTVPVVLLVPGPGIRSGRVCSTRYPVYGTVPGTV